MGPSWGLLEPSWGLFLLLLGPCWGPFGPPGASWRPLGDPWGLLAPSWGLWGLLGPILGSFWSHFGVISGIISEPFLHHFEDIVFRTVLERLWPHFGDVVAPIGPLKTAKNVERLIEFEDFRSSARDSVLMSSRSLFGGLFCYKNDPKSEPKRVRKQVGI